MLVFLSGSSHSKSTSRFRPSSEVLALLQALLFGTPSELWSDVQAHTWHAWKGLFFNQVMPGQKCWPSDCLLTALGPSSWCKVRRGCIHDHQFWALRHCTLWSNWALVSSYLAVFEVYPPLGTSLFQGQQDGVRPSIRLWLARKGRTEGAPIAEPRLQVQSWVFPLAKSHWGCGVISSLLFWSTPPAQSPT